MSTPMSSRSRLYREFLTTALHRRFTSAAGVVLLACFAESILIGDKSSWRFWLWFPLGPAGLRTLLLFISALSIFLLRVAQLHFGARTTSSSFETFRQFAFRFDTVRTLLWYLFSAWWFSEVYVWSAPDAANLSWVIGGKSHERPRLNERPIYLRSVLFMTALLQSSIHLGYDYDRILLPLSVSKADPAPNQRSSVTSLPQDQLKREITRILQRALQRSLPMIVLGPFIYSLFLRRYAWSWTHSFAKLLFNLQRSSEPSRIPPYHISLIFRSVTSSFLLILLWEISTVTFGAYVAQAPLKRGNPLTDQSKDPNESLLNGLKSKKETSKTFAFWELLWISQNSERRRKSIFSEIDRAGGSTWSQVMTACLEVMQGINTRVSNFQNPIATLQPKNTSQTLQSLPRLSAPLKQGPILTNSPRPTTWLEGVESGVGTFAKSIGQAPPSQGSKAGISLSARAKQHIGGAKDKLLTQEQQVAINSDSLKSQFKHYLMQFLRSPFGRPFRQTFRRRLCAIVLGSQNGDANILVDAVDSLTCLAVASLQEDNLGKVQKDIPGLIRIYVDTTKKLESLVGGLAVHWTDVDRQESHWHGSRKVEEIDVILGCLKGGLGELLGAFGTYATTLGIGPGEMRVAREAAGLDSRE